MDLPQSRSYALPMRLFMLFALLISVQPALAMNWEGHEEGWMGELQSAQEFANALPQAKPLPTRKCSRQPAARSDNPYEQIPLPRHHCPPPQPGKLPEN